MEGSTARSLHIHGQAAGSLCPTTLGLQGSCSPHPARGAGGHLRPWEFHVLETSRGGLAFFPAETLQVLCPVLTLGMPQKCCAAPGSPLVAAAWAGGCVLSLACHPLSPRLAGKKGLLLIHTSVWASDLICCGFG